MRLTAFGNITRIVCIHTRIIVSIIMLSVFNTTSYAYSSDYADVGLPDTEIFNSIDHQGTALNWGLIQNDKGLIYAGNGRGLSEWDGERWAIYTSTNKTAIYSVSQWTDKRLYVGTVNDIGYFSADETGRLEYSSLVQDWPSEQRQFGTVTSTASNDSSVLFTTNNATYRWNGQQLTLLNGMPTASSGLFEIGNNFVYQAINNPYLYKITPEMDIVRTHLRLPEAAKARVIIENNDKQLVVFTEKSGVFVQSNDKLEQKITPAMFGEQVTLYSGIQASDGYYYVSTVNNGIFIINDSFKVLRHYTKEDNLGSNSFHHLMEDNQGNIWLSGVLNISKMVPPHRYSRYTIEGQSRLSNHLKLINNKVTIAGEGIYELDDDKPSLNTPRFRQKLDNTREYWDFLEFEDQFIYAGIGGIFAQSLGNETLLQPPTTIISAQQGRSLLLNTHTNSLFAGTDRGLYVIKRVNGQWQTHALANVVDNIQTLSIDKNNVVWAGTPNQVLYRIEQSRQNGDIGVTKLTGADGLGANNVIPVKLSIGLLIGTNNGAMEYDIKQQPSLAFVSGFPPIFTTPEHDVYRLFEDPKGRIWYRIGDYTGYIFKDENKQWKAQDKIFGPLPIHSYKGFITTEPNILWFIMNGGIVYRTNVDLFESFPKQAKLNIRSIIDLSTQQNISGGLRLRTLDQNTNSIRINYALAENASHNPTQYRHRLLGSNYEKWSPWSNEATKDFTQLHGADYQFELEAKDSWGRVSKTQIPFTVLPPWYLSIAALVLYSFCLFLSLVLSGWLTQRWRTASLKKQKKNLQRKVALRTQEVLEKNNALHEEQAIKDRFFANVSHEFRTPLTLTIEPLKFLLAQHSSTLKNDAALLVTTALNNAKTMLNLVGQVLDINRLDAGKLPLRIGEHDIAELLRLLQQRFSYMASQEGQEIICVNCENSLFVHIDIQKIEQSVTNLISNAIKYSGKNTQITLVLHNMQNNVVIDVNDNGIGLSDNDKERVFERFFQSSASKQLTKPGTGIGLALVKAYTELHKGKVSLRTSLNKGCCFSLHLKKGKAHFDSKQIENAILVTEAEPDKLANADLAQNAGNESAELNCLTKHNPSDVTTILVVDDNAELRNFISLRLSESYRVLQAANGKLGFSTACECLPDLIISDVMMPIMTGLELCEKLRDTPATQTIPIILLTAKATKREVVEGFSSGADDYLSKPFDTSELIMRVNALLNIRKIVSQQVAIDQSRVILQLDNTSKFTQTFTEHVLAHFHETDMSVEMLADLMHMTSKTLARRCKKELGISPLAYIIQLRMQHASILLDEGKLSVSEIAYSLGYESLAYFSNSFKKHTGKAPSDFKR